MLQNAYFLAKIGADTAENEQHFAEILPKTGNYPTGPRPRAVVFPHRVLKARVGGPRTHLELFGFAMRAAKWEQRCSSGFMTRETLFS